MRTLTARVWVEHFADVAHLGRQWLGIGIELDAGGLPHVDPVGLLDLGGGGDAGDVDVLGHAAQDKIRSEHEGRADSRMSCMVQAGQYADGGGAP